MSKLAIKTTPAFEAKMLSYPARVRPKMQYLRELVQETAKQIPDIQVLDETLKWGEPSFVSKIGSTLRMDWKEKSPNQYQLYFNCSSRLVETFKMVFNELFEYEKNRAIIFKIRWNYDIIYLN